MLAIGRVAKRDHGPIKFEVIFPAPTPRYMLGNVPQTRTNVREGEEHGLFEFDPQDQFAYFISLDKVKVVA